GGSLADRAGHPWGNEPYRAVPGEGPSRRAGVAVRPFTERRRARGSGLPPHRGVDPFPPSPARSRNRANGTHRLGAARVLCHAPRGTQARRGAGERSARLRFSGRADRSVAAQQHAAARGAFARPCREPPAALALGHDRPALEAARADVGSTPPARDRLTQRALQCWMALQARMRKAALWFSAVNGSLPGVPPSMSISTSSWRRRGVASTTAPLASSIPGRPR